MTHESLKEDGRPSQQWYWDDWFSEFGLRLCSLAARGLWIDMLGIMFKAEIRGTFTINGKQVDNKALAKIVGDTEENINKYIEELETNDVFSRLEDRTIISRRMYRESKRKEEISRIRSDAGKKGMIARWGEAEKGKDNKDITKENNKKITKITASSSISSSTSSPSPNNKRESKDSLCLKKISDEDQILTQLLIDLMLRNDPNSSIIRRLTEKRQIEWMDACRKLREIDKRPPELIERIIRFSQDDDFWHKNILSMTKLREKFDQLFLKAKREKFSGIKEWLEDKENE